MGGSSKTTSSSAVPAWVSDAQKAALAQATAASRIGNVGYYGPDVAAMTPSQIAAMQGTNAAASAFGQQTVDPMAGMPAASNYGGMNAYSSGAGYDAALAELKARFPGQFDAIMAMFVNPATGAMPGASGAGVTGMQQAAQRPQSLLDRITSGGGGGGGGGYQPPGTSSGGYVNLRDMYDGGGPGMSGTTFSGGPLSGRLNTLGVQPAAPMRPPAAPPRPASSAKTTNTKVTGRR